MNLATVLEIVALCLLAVVLFGGPLAIMFLRLTGPDRRQYGFSAEDPPWVGKFSATYMVSAVVDARQAIAIASAAIERTGGRDVEMWGGETVIGWWARAADLTGDRQLAVVVRTDPRGVVHFLCCCRPRYCRDYFDFGVSRQRVNKLGSNLKGIINTAA